MNQHRGSGGVRESTGAELLLTPISSAEHTSQGWSFGFPHPEPQFSCKKTSRGPCEHAAHVSQCPGSSLVLGVPLARSGTAPQHCHGTGTALVSLSMAPTSVRTSGCAPVQGHQCRQTPGTQTLSSSQPSFPPQLHMPTDHKPTSTHCRLCPEGTTTSAARKRAPARVSSCVGAIHGPGCFRELSVSPNVAHKP